MFSFSSNVAAVDEVSPIVVLKKTNCRRSRMEVRPTAMPFLLTLTITLTLTLILTFNPRRAMVMTYTKKAKVAHTRLPSVGSRS